MKCSIHDSKAQCCITPIYPTVNTAPHQPGKGHQPPVHVLDADPKRNGRMNAEITKGSATTVATWTTSRKCVALNLEDNCMPSTITEMTSMTLTACVALDLIQFDDNVDICYTHLQPEPLTVEMDNNLHDCFRNATGCSGVTTSTCNESFLSLNVSEECTDTAAMKALSLVLRTVLSVLLALIMLSMGCSVKWMQLLYYLKHPWQAGLAIGCLCQFGIMPLAAFTLALSLRMSAIEAVTVIIMGSSPGGNLSNVLCFWLDGDMDLSISMTSASSLLALGFMPLCLLVYTKPWIDGSTITIPYLTLAISLISLVVPTSLGIALNYKWPKTARIVLKVGSVTGIVLMTVAGAVGIALYSGSWFITPVMWIAAAVMPVSGYVLSLGISKLSRQPWKQCRTISLETGTQNIQLCLTVLQFSFPLKLLAGVTLFPLLYSAAQLVCAASLAFVFQVYKRTHPQPEQEHSTGVVEPEGVKTSVSVVNLAFDMTLESEGQGGPAQKTSSR
uniref:ileal sodium/bile acid cotransporter-like n=1 Tax=Myxine glutinosa TaxID=7769 RepID=UPI00358FB25E